MNLLLLVVVVISIVAVGAVLGLVKSVLRLAAALIVGLLIPGLAYLGTKQLGFSIPNAVYVFLGALSALSVLVRRR